ncbi:MAG: tRNA dihydrouridine synthase DusB [Maricaulaceae bacterium]
MNADDLKTLFRETPAVLAPMSGVSDLAFRRAAKRWGAGLVVSEMVACDALADRRPDMVRRAAGDAEVAPVVIQLAGREAKWMKLGAAMAVDAGAAMVDINMGCPAKMVTKAASGSALMRDLDHALTLIEATVAGAGAVPVSLKMRMGWDHQSLNAPELARRAVAAGVQMITVHGRTRCQFYEGTADWDFVAKVRAEIKVPLIMNGDITSVGAARHALAASGADAVMVGRGAYGRPWKPGAIAHALQSGEPETAPATAAIVETIQTQFDDTLSLYGVELGGRVFRKHIGWYVQTALGPGDEAAGRTERKRLCKLDDPNQALAGLLALFEAGTDPWRRAA